MSPLSTAELRTDIRYLATIDTRHRFLRAEEDGGVREGWFERTGLIILTERARDGTPLVGVMLKYPSVCLVDDTATLQIKYWVANLERPADLDVAFRANIAAINSKMAELGVQRVWGLVPKNADHLTSRLDPIAEAAKCTKTDGANVVDASNPENRYSGFDFLVGDRDEVNNWVQAS